MWIYKKSENTNKYLVGYIYKDNFQNIKSFEKEEDAQQCVNHLNGGTSEELKKIIKEQNEQIKYLKTRILQNEQNKTI